MATKNELAAEAAEFAKELGIDVSTENLNHAELTALVNELEAKYEAQLGGALTPPEPTRPTPAPPPRPAIDGASDGSLGGPPPKVPPVPKVAKGAYVVAPGKSLVTRAGVMTAGNEMLPKYVDGGRAQLEELLAKGYLVKGGE